MNMYSSFVKISLVALILANPFCCFAVGCGDRAPQKNCAEHVCCCGLQANAAADVDTANAELAAPRSPNDCPAELPCQCLTAGAVVAKSPDANLLDHGCCTVFTSAAPCEIDAHVRIESHQQPGKLAAGRTARVLFESLLC